MKKIKTLFFALVMTLFMVTLVAGCGKKTKSNKETVKVKSITAVNSTSANTGVKMAKLNMPLYDEPKDISTSTEGFNYFVIVKSEHNVTITITIDNPKDYQIDMIKVASSDKEASIKVWNNQDAVFQPIDTQPIVRWNSTGGYASTYDLITKQDANEVTFTVSDIKVNGAWQETEDLGNNVLHVYKYDNNDLSIKVIKNTFNNGKSELQFKVEAKNAINVKNVTIEDDNYTEDNGIYTITSNEYNKYTFDVNENIRTINVAYTYQLTDKVESSLLKTSFTVHLCEVENSFIYTPENFELYINVSLIGSEIDENEIVFYYEGVTNIPSVGTYTVGNHDYKFKFINPNWNSFDDIDADIMKTTISINNINFKVKNLGNSGYLTLELAN